MYPAIVLEKNNFLGFCPPMDRYTSSYECMNPFNERKKLIKIGQSMYVKLKESVSAMLPFKVLFIYYIYDVPPFTLYEKVIVFYIELLDL